MIAAADKRALELKGVIPDPYPDQIRAMFDRLEGELDETTIEPFAKLIQAELLPYIQLTEIGERSWSKPRGYAGDYLTIEMVYKEIDPRVSDTLAHCSIVAC